MDWSTYITLGTVETQMVAAGGLVLAVSIAIFGFKRIRSFFGGK